MGEGIINAEKPHNFRRNRFDHKKARATTEDLEEHDGQRESLAITTLLDEGFLP